MEKFICKVEITNGPHAGQHYFVNKYAADIFSVEPDNVIVRECQNKAVAYKFDNRAIGESKPIFRYVHLNLPEVKWRLPDERFSK